MQDPYKSSQDLTLAISWLQIIMAKHPQQPSCSQGKKFKKQFKNHEMNQALERLKCIVPKKPSDRMSKIKTLRLAIQYIYYLNQVSKHL